ncbi:MAG: acetylglutamate kinase [Kordiimonadaceae bacterium]|nr:acetylglutamate kinase [Kordiimonadaceae bacterium]MBT6467647.1 acetylglutamate kinase [Kordiimonadaceae bacterium]
MKTQKNYLKSALIELLSQFGRKSEALIYLNKFSNTAPCQFAIIKIGGGVLADDLESIVKAITFMQNLDLIPILVHGAGPQLDQVLTQNKINTTKTDGIRVTSAKAIKYVRKVMYDESHKLISALEANNVKARSFHHGVFECTYLNQKKYGLVGKPETVITDNIFHAIKNGSIPIITPLGETKFGQMVNINADTATKALAKVIQPQKIIFLTPSGGIWDQNKQHITAINLTTDYSYLMKQDWIKEGMRVKLRETQTLLEQLPDNSSVSITSADCLIRELFTHQGAGTLIRKGENISALKILPKNMVPKSKFLLESCFNKTLKPDYFKKLILKQVIWSKSKRAIAIITEGKNGIPYLDKFAVTPEAQGEGLGAALWVEIKKNNPALYWRSRTSNVINNWYISKSDTMIRDQDWLILSYGIKNKNTLDLIKKDALNRTSSWIRTDGFGEKL